MGNIIVRRTENITSIVIEIPSDEKGPYYMVNDDVAIFGILGEGELYGRVVSFSTTSTTQVLRLVLKGTHKLVHIERKVSEQ